MGKIKRKEIYICRDENLHYLLTYGILLIWVGIASFYMHGSNRSTLWFSSAFLDGLSMNIYMSGIIIMSLGILFDFKKRNFYIIFIVDIIIVVILMKSEIHLPSFGGGGLFELFLIFALVNELLIGFGVYSKVFKSKGVRQIKRNIGYLALVIIIFLLGFWLWHFGLSGDPTCDLYSWWQWHAVWHFFTACAMIVIALYLLSERETELSY